MSMTAVKTALFNANAIPSRTRENLLRDIISLPTHMIQNMARENGDEDLKKVVECGCLNRIHRMTAVRADEARQSTSFEEFTSMILGDSYHGHSQIRRGATRRRR